MDGAGIKKKTNGAYLGIFPQRYGHMLICTLGIMFAFRLNQSASLLWILVPVYFYNNSGIA
jgi:hypothetical protein